MRALKTEAIWPQQMHAVTPRDFVQLGGQRGVNATGDHQGGTAFDATGNLQSGGHLGRWQGNDRQIRLGVRQIAQGAADVDIQKHQRTGKALRPQSAVQSLRLRRLGRWIVGLANKDSNRTRRKKRREKVLVHTDSNKS